MIIVNSPTIAILLCFITMFCWGSHANSLKLVDKKYPFSLYYWDQALGYLLLPLILGLTFGSFGLQGRSLVDDLFQGSVNSYGMALLGGVVFNLANILFISAVNVAGMAVGFPIGIGIALIEGVVINYIAQPLGNPVIIFAGVLLITLAIVVDALAYKKLQSSSGKQVSRNGIMLAISGGVLMGLFYYLVQQSISPNFASPETGKFGPYAAVLIFSVGSFLSNFIFNSYLMRKPITGAKATYSNLFAKGNAKNHWVGILGGMVNGLGVSLNLIASEKVGNSIAYGLGQGATMVAAIWGVFIWKEFKDAPKQTNRLIALMFLLYIAGLILLVFSKK